ncbi:MAG TPA: transglycosylase SLT domain-containing protein [Thermoanaerobaculia bacterium]|nr:transglycosylase SLT domain-containing protein [Thermoanaerobaculia bacterium]
MKKLRTPRFAPLALTGALLVGGLGSAWNLQNGASAPEASAVETTTAASHSLSTARAMPAVVERRELDLPNLDNPRVDHWVERFTGSLRPDLEIRLERMGRYEEMISRKLAERDMPQDLVYLAMMESGFSPTAFSSASASGLWQFMPATGKHYGLDINRAVDERNDPELATDAALDYLDRLHDRFGSWYLAAAAYNCGQGRLARIMRQHTGRVKGTDADFYAIARYLPGETREYVPRIIAAARIGHDREGFGFDDVKPQPAPVYQLVEVAPATPLAEIARAHGTTVATIRDLNPQLKIDRVRNDERARVRVPAGTRT